MNYDICFLDDFKDAMKGVNTNYYGIIDQMIASKGDVFVGTAYSTLSAYINRIRGYYSTRDKLAGYENGELKSYYFMPHEMKTLMTRYLAPKTPIWAYEFPLAWRDIDHGISEVQ